MKIFHTKLLVSCKNKTLIYVNHLQHQIKVLKIKDMHESRLHTPEHSTKMTMSMILHVHEFFYLESNLHQNVPHF